MGIIKNDPLKNLENTDNLINLENVAQLSKPLTKTIRAIALSCDSLFKKQYSLFLTGSLAVCLRSGSLEEFRKTGDKSDIDLWIVADTLSKKLFTPSSYEKEIIRGFSRLNFFDISCIPFPDNKFKISLKIMCGASVKKVLRLNKNSFKVFRINSLKKIKSEDMFYGLKGNHYTSVFEEKLENAGFLWHWSADPFMKKDFVLTDIHSCFLIGGFLIDNLKLEKRDQYLKKFYFYFKKYCKKNCTDNQFKILRYFYERFPLSATKIFGEEKGADSFMENAP
ncbi:MAG: hypothetical protein AAB392_01830 [Patescibacteria group bacterium]